MLDNFLFGSLGALTFDFYKYCRRKHYGGVRWHLNYIFWTIPWLLLVGGLAILLTQTGYTAFFFGLFLAPFASFIAKDY